VTEASDVARLEHAERRPRAAHVLPYGEMVRAGIDRILPAPDREFHGVRRLDPHAAFDFLARLQHGTDEMEW
jgi:hypothetical protein